MPRRSALALLVGALLLALVFWLWPGGEAPRAATGTPIAQTSPAPVSSPAPEAAPSPSPGLVELDDVAPPGALPEVPKQAPPIEISPDTQRLAAEFVPGTTEWEDVPIDESGALSVRILPVRYNVVAPDPIVVSIEVADRQGHRVRAPGAGVRVRPMASTSDTDWIELPTVDDGSGGDEHAGDLRYTATLAPSAAQQALLLGRVLVEGRVDIAGAGLRRVPTSLIYTRGPLAHLTGGWRDWIEDGHLRLDAEVAVEKAGVYTMNAQIVGPDRQPIAWVRGSATLAAGVGHLPLQVWGKALRDAGIDGPYRVRNVLLVREVVETGDYEPGRTIEEAHRTRPYRATDFSDKVWVDPGPEGPQVGPDDPSQRGKPPAENQRVNVGP